MVKTIFTIAKNIGFIRRNMDFVVKKLNIAPQIEAKMKHYAVGLAFLVVAIFMIVLSILFFALYLFFVIANLDSLTTPGLIFASGSFILGLLLLLVGIKQLKY